MKTLALLFALAALNTGCASINFTQTKPDGTKVGFSAQSLFANSTLKGLGVDGTTKTTSYGLKLSATGTEPNAESITATGTALGDLIGTAAKSVAKP